MADSESASAGGKRESETALELPQVSAAMCVPGRCVSGDDEAYLNATNIFINPRAHAAHTR